MLPFWVWLTGAALMAALGPSPRWLAREFQHADDADLRGLTVWMLWWLQTVLWPAALCVYARQAMYSR